MWILPTITKLNYIDDLTKDGGQSVGQIFHCEYSEDHVVLCKLLKIQMTYEACLPAVVSDILYLQWNLSAFCVQSVCRAVAKGGT